MPLIEVHNLRKEFRSTVRKQGLFATLRTLITPEYTTKTAVENISFALEQGEMVGYVGPNGAGKSTTIKMLTGILMPTGGSVQVAGRDPQQDRRAHMRHIGVVFGQKSQLWWDVPVVESLELLKHIYNIPNEVYQRNRKRFDELLDLHEFQNTPVRQLSLGQRMRADLAAALLHSPDILFLDEPTIGVDVVAKERFRNFVRALNREMGVTVLLTTHDMVDIEKICERLIIIDKGKIIYDGSLIGLKDRYMPYRILEVELGELDAAERLAAVGNTLFADDRVSLLAHKENKVRFRFDRRQLSASELIVKIVENHTVRDITIEEPEIEAIIRDIYRNVP